MSSVAQAPLHNDFQSTQPAPQRRGCLGVGLGCILGVVVLGVLLCGGFVGGIAFFAFSVIKSAEPYKDTLQTAQSSAEVQAELGQPIEAGMFVSGNINLQNSEGEADISYPISGPKGSATVNVRATREGGQWTYQSVLVRPEQGQTKIDLTDELNGSAVDVDTLEPEDTGIDNEDAGE